MEYKLRPTVWTIENPRNRCKNNSCLVLKVIKDWKRKLKIKLII
ncbi:MAG: hypothetical protein ABIL47_09005 [candidate division WOR-3 bacterium]